MKHRWIARLTALLLALAVLWPSVSACSEDEKQENIRQAFATALASEDYSEAQRLYRKLRYRADFDEEATHDMLKQRMEQTAEHYLSGMLTYDQAAVRLDQLTMGGELEDALGDYRDQCRLTMNRALAEEDRASLAGELNNLGAYREAIELYQAILADDPERGDVERGLQQAINGYVNEIQQDVSRLRGAQLIHQALLRVRHALELLPNHADLRSLEETLLKDLENHEITLDTRRALIEIDQLLSTDHYDEAMKLIEATREDPNYRDKLEDLDTLEQRAKDAYAQSFIRRAESDDVGQDPEAVHWESPPYAAELAVIREGLEALPGHARLEQAAARYEAQIPVNFLGRVAVKRGKTRQLKEGTDYYGYTYSGEPDMFNEPLTMLGAGELQLSNADGAGAGAPWDYFRLVIAPGAANRRYHYDDYKLEVLIDGERAAAFDDNFETRDEPLVYEFDIRGKETVEIRLIRDTLLGMLGSAGSEPFFLEGYLWDAPPATDEATDAE